MISRQSAMLSSQTQTPISNVNISIHQRAANVLQCSGSLSECEQSWESVLEVNANVADIVCIALTMATRIQASVGPARPSPAQNEMNGYSSTMGIRQPSPSCTHLQHPVRSQSGGGFPRSALELTAADPALQTQAQVDTPNLSYS